MIVTKQNEAERSLSRSIVKAQMIDVFVQQIELVLY